MSGAPDEPAAGPEDTARLDEDLERERGQLHAWFRARRLLLTAVTELDALLNAKGATLSFSDRRPAGCLWLIEIRLAMLGHAADPALTIRVGRDGSQAIEGMPADLRPTSALGNIVDVQLDDYRFLLALHASLVSHLKIGQQARSDASH